MNSLIQRRYRTVHVTVGPVVTSMKPGENTRKCTVTRACSSFYGACGVQAARPAGGSHGHRVTVSRDYPGVDGHGVYYSPTRMPLPLTRLPSRPACQCARGQGLAVAAEPDWAGPLSDHSGLDSVSDPPASHHDYNLTSSGDCYHSGSESGRHDDCQHERPRCLKVSQCSCKLPQ